MTRSLFSGMPVVSAISTRRTCGIWVDDQIVSSPLVPIGEATTALVSIGDGISRWLTNRRLTTTSASATAFS